MDKPTCGTCPYWIRYVAEFDGDPPPPSGMCVVLPPRPELREFASSRPAPMAVWPTTHQTQVCARHPGYRQIVNAWWEANQPEGEP